MKIKVVVVDLELSRRAKRVGMAVALAAVIVAGAALSRAALTTPLHVWNTGDVLTAADLNNNFGNLTGLDGRITAQESKTAIVHNTTSAYAEHANFCGITSAFDGANVGGYAGARTKCMPVCVNSPTAHACTSEELVRSAALGVSIPTTGAWFASGVFAQYGGENVTDCAGFTSRGTTILGTIWQNGAPTVDHCVNVWPIACCD